MFRQASDGSVTPEDMTSAADRTANAIRTYLEAEKTAAHILTDFMTMQNVIVLSFASQPHYAVSVLCGSDSNMLLGGCHIALAC